MKRPSFCFASKIFIVFALLLGFPTYVAAQVCAGPITLTTQLEVNAFSCTSVTGNLTIKGVTLTEITDLGPLSGLVTVEGNLVISTNTLSNVADRKYKPRFSEFRQVSVAVN